MPFDEATPHVIRTFDDVRTAYPRDSTLKNLLLLSNERLEECGRFAIFAYEAQREGFELAGALFERLAAGSRADAEALLSVLQRHLAETESRRPQAPTETASRRTQEPTASTPAA